MTESATPTTRFVQELAANVDALLEHTLEQIQKPPAGSIAEVGHFRLLNALKKKESEALEQLLEDFAYNITATLLAMLDGAVDGEGVPLPKIGVTLDGAAPERPLHEQFAESWENE